MSLPTLTQEQKQGFFEKMYSYAQKASQGTNVPVSVILSQWALESYYGFSDLVKRGTNNLAGIKYIAGKSIATGPSGMYASYSSFDQFVQDYIRVMGLSYYKDVREITTVNPVEETVSDLAKSPWAESHYGGGANLLNIIKSFGLTKYDGQQINQDGVAIPRPVISDGKAIFDISGLDDKSVAGMLIIGAGMVLLYGLTSLIGGERHA